MLGDCYACCFSCKARMLNPKGVCYLYKSDSEYLRLWKGKETSPKVCGPSPEVKMSGPKEIHQVRSTGKVGPRLRVVGLWIIAREQVRKASDYVREQGNVKENKWQGLRVRNG